jgi:hypothetical protein
VESWHVVIDSGSQPQADLLHELGSLDLASDGINVEQIKPPFTFRGVDPAILVATIGAVSTTLTALIAGIFKLRGNSNDEKISIEFASGDKVTIPASMPADERDRLLETMAGKRPTRLILP